MAKLKPRTIRLQLLVAFVLLVILPVTITSLIFNWLHTANREQHVFDQLESVATLKEAELITWQQNLQNELAFVLRTREERSWTWRFLKQ